MVTKSILIVDDQYGIRVLLSEVLQRDGYKVVEASNGRFALEAYRKHRPDLILLDIRMPRIDGIEVLEQIRKEDRHVHILAMTAFELEKEETEWLYSMGVHQIYKKPFDLDELRQNISTSISSGSKQIYNKLVRDRIPDIIQNSGKTCCVKVLDEQGYVRELRRKLQEEWQEYLAASDDSEGLAELADVMEVVYALAEIHGASTTKLEEIRKSKAERNGVFTKKILLIDVEEGA